MWVRFVLILVAMAASACGPALFFPPPSVSSLSPEWQQPGLRAVVLRREVALRYLMEDDAVAPLRVDVCERVQVRMLAPAAVNPTEWVSQGSPTGVLVDAAARLTRSDGRVIASHPPPGGVLQLPDAAAGELLDFYVRRRDNFPQGMPPWVLASTVPTVRVRVEVQGPAGLRMRVIRGDVGGHAEVSQDARGVFVVEAERLAPLAVAGPTVPGPRQTGPWVLVVPQAWAPRGGGPAVEWATSWTAVGDYVRHVIKPTQQLDEAAGRLFAASPLLVRERYRPRSGEHLFSPWPRPFTALDGNRASSLEAATILAVATARETSGAALVLASDPTGTAVLEDVPGLYPWRGALLGVSEGTGWRFFDPACETCSAQEVALVYAGARVLILTSAGPAFATVPVAAAQHEQRRYQYDLRMSVDGVVTGTGSVEWQGLGGTNMRVELATRPADAGRRLLQQLVLVGSPWQVESFDEDTELAAATQRYGLRLNLSGRLERADRDISLTGAMLGGSGFPWELPAAAAVGVVVPGPLVTEVSCTLAMPFDISGKRMKPVSVVSPLGTYQASFQVTGRLVLYTRRLWLAAHRVAGNEMAVLQDFAARIRAADATPVVLKVED